MESIVVEVHAGANQASNHYVATGHKIEHLMMEEKVGMDFIDRKSKYQCTECGFVSYGGKRVKIS